MERQIYHITTFEEWEQAQSKGEYQPASFATEGFIHCSYRSQRLLRRKTTKPALTVGQLLPVANKFFRGKNNLVILAIATGLLDRKIVEENLVCGVELFPHLYGLLPVAAVTEIVAFPCKSNGSFTLPAKLSSDRTNSLK